MKALLICPAHRPAVAWLAESRPLVSVPMLGKSLIEYWLDHLALRGTRCVRVVASDRPDQVRKRIGDGGRWGLEIETLPERRELSVLEACAKYPGWDEVVLVDHPPGMPQHPLFSSYASWFAALAAWMPRSSGPDRIGLHEMRPGVWIGWRARVHSSARLQAPCWIGDNAVVGADAVIGPQAIIEDRAWIGTGAQISHSAIGRETYVGEFTTVRDSLAQGAMLIKWKTGSCFRVPDAFLLSSLGSRRAMSRWAGPAGRLLALAVLLATSPLALAAVWKARRQGRPALWPRLAARPPLGALGNPADTFVYRELDSARGWLRRWPQLWSIARGDLAWIGNRPLEPAEAAMLKTDFARLWLAAPPGLISLADAEGCAADLSAESCAHASYYAVCASRRLRWSILARALGRAIPIRRRARPSQSEPAGSAVAPSLQPQP